jgi:hypothetical protein
MKITVDEIEYEYLLNNKPIPDIDWGVIADGLDDMRCRCLLESLAKYERESMVRIHADLVCNISE